MDKTLLIIGAGCSAGSMHLPVDTNFLSIKHDDIIKSYFLDKAIRKLYYENGIVYEWRTYRLEVVWSEIFANIDKPKIILRPDEIEDIYHNLKSLSTEEDSKNFKRRYYNFYQVEDSKNRTPYEYLFMFAEWELRKLVCATYNRGIKDDKKELYNKLLNLIGKRESLEIVSFNYDTLMEQVLDKYHYAIIDDSNSEGIKVIKPHGSTNWLTISNQDVKRPFAPIRKMKSLHTSEDFGYNEGNFYEPELVGLIDVKQEYNSWQWPVYQGLRDALRSSVMDATTIIIIGYSFPHGDRHIRGILKNAKAVMERDKKPFLKKIITVCYLSKENEQEIQNELYNLFHVEKKNIEIYPEYWEKWIINRSSI